MLSAFQNVTNHPLAPRVTPRELQLLRLIDQGREKIGAAPTYDELAEVMGCYKNAVRDKIQTLLLKGLVIRTYGVARSMRLTPAGRGVIAE